MRIKSIRKSTKPKKLLLTAIILIVLISAFIVLEMTGVTHFISSPNNQTTDQKKEAETDSNEKQNLIEGKTDNQNTGGTVPDPTADDIGLSTRRETDGSVTILTELRNYSDGTCDLSINNGNEIYNQTALVLYQDSFSSCAGFSIPADTLSNGTWQISLTVTSKGKVNTKTTSMEVQ